MKFCIALLTVCSVIHFTHTMDPEDPKDAAFKEIKQLVAALSRIPPQFLNPKTPYIGVAPGIFTNDQRTYQKKKPKSE